MTYSKNQTFTNDENSLLTIKIANFEKDFYATRTHFMVNLDNREEWLNESQLDNLINDYGFNLIN